MLQVQYEWRSRAQHGVSIVPIIFFYYLLKYGRGLFARIPDKAGLEKHHQRVSLAVVAAGIPVVVVLWFSRPVDYVLAPHIRVDEFGVMTTTITNTGAVTTTFEVDVLIQDSFLHPTMQPSEAYVPPIPPDAQGEITAILPSSIQRLRPVRVQFWVNDGTGVHNQGGTVLERSLKLSRLVGHKYEAEEFTGVVADASWSQLAEGWGSKERNSWWSGGRYAVTRKVGAVMSQTVNLTPGSYQVSLRVYDFGDGGHGAVAVKLGGVRRVVEMDYTEVRFEIIRVPVSIDQPVEELVLETPDVPNFTRVLVDCVVVQDLAQQ